MATLLSFADPARRALRRGFATHTRHFSLIFSRGICRDWSLRLLVGRRTFSCGPAQPYTKGAGYIGGATLFVTWNCVTRESRYRPTRRLRVGVTQSANNVPWTRH